MTLFKPIRYVTDARTGEKFVIRVVSDTGWRRVA